MCAVKVIHISLTFEFASTIMLSILVLASYKFAKHFVCSLPSSYKMKYIKMTDPEQKSEDVTTTNCLPNNNRFNNGSST